jgi:chromosome partitioning protein
MQIIAVLGQKGGSGKTTLATGLAVAAMRAGSSPVILDTDEQGTAAAWGRRRGTEVAPPVLACRLQNLAAALAAAPAQGFDLAIIDAAGKASADSVAIARLASLVVIPLRPALGDVETLATMRDVLRAAGQPPAVAVLNGAPVRADRHEQARELIGQYGLDVAAPVLFQRIAHADAMNYGLAAMEREPRGKAALEMQALYAYIITRMRAYARATNKRKAHV